MKKENIKDTKLIIYAFLGFLGIDKIYKGSIKWFIIKILLFVFSVVFVTWVSGIGNVLGLITSIVFFIWWLLDFIHALLGSYEVSPFTYLK